MEDKAKPTNPGKRPKPTPASPKKAKLNLQWNYMGKDMTEDEVMQSMMKDFFEDFKIPEPEPHKLSLFEYILCTLLSASIKSAHEQDIKEPRKLAGYLTGMLAARFDLDRFGRLVADMKVSEKLMKERDTLIDKYEMSE